MKKVILAISTFSVWRIALKTVGFVDAPKGKLGGVEFIDRQVSPC
ncbi:MULTISPECIES: hypothetical protein [unclassified Microcoleus]|nr:MULTISPECIES: hypothetical protein [unclassified Microcoleus]